jgi:hypothetical protein
MTVAINGGWGTLLFIFCGSVFCYLTIVSFSRVKGYKAFLAGLDKNTNPEIEGWLSYSEWLIGYKYGEINDIEDVDNES